MQKVALSLVAGVAAHYGDPYQNGCEKDEISAQITGIAGATCIPPCATDGSCPMDVPAGVTAKPQCALNSPTGAKYCILVCDDPPAGKTECGANASCKQATGSGLCTYDDAPGPPSSTHWKGVSSPTFDALSEALNVAFTKDGKTGYCGAGDNSVGPQIVKTTDSGETWTRIFPAPGDKPKPDLFLASAIKDENSAIVTGVLFQAYTTTGTYFNSSKNEFVEPSQDAKVTPGGLFAIVVDGNSGSGIATSKTGEVWQTAQLTANISIYPPRYGAYPTDTTWYLSAGNFPTSSAKKGSNLKHLTHKVALDLDTTSYKLNYPKGDVSELFAPSPSDPVSCVDDPTNCFSAGIFRTDDAGKTWTMTYSDLTNNVYPNGIDCISADHCIATVEGDSCQILLTTDGGKTWTPTNTDTDPACSLTYVAMLSETEAWVGGGHLSALDFEGRFWHTLDGGKTWEKEAVKGLYIFDLDMPAPTVGYAVGITASGSGVGLLKYDATGSA